MVFGRDLMKNLAVVSQFGLSFITPLLVCLAVCWLLCDRTGVGGWVYIVGFFFGMGSSWMVAYKLYLSVTNKEKKDKKQKKERVAFNRHL